MTSAIFHYLRLSLLPLSLRPFLLIKESTDFAASEAELVDSIDTLDRAIRIISAEMQKNPAALAQVDTTRMASIVQSIGAVVEASAFSTSDRQKLLALVQSQQQTEADDTEFGAPAAATYKTHSTSIVDVLEDLKEKAEAELSDLRKAEVCTRIVATPTLTVTYSYSCYCLWLLLLLLLFLLRQRLRLLLLLLLFLLLQLLLLLLLMLLLILLLIL